MIPRAGWGGVGGNGRLAVERLGSCAFQRGIEDVGVRVLRRV